jgi:ubiquitin thioesterase protein OTUB1
MSSQTTLPPPGQGQDEAATQQAAPRVIDENTDMSTLTDQEIMRLMEGMGHNDDAMSKVSPQISVGGWAGVLILTLQPLISPPTPLMVIRDEYLNGSPTVVKKLDWLQENGWDQVWRARGDGDCFYRCK